MFTKKELESVKQIAEVKIDDILHHAKDFTAESLRDLQTLMKLKDAAEKRKGI